MNAHSQIKTWLRLNQTLFHFSRNNDLRQASQGGQTRAEKNQPVNVKQQQNQQQQNQQQQNQQQQNQQQQNQQQKHQYQQ
ncbi:hypothetical protein E4U60_004122 [Claviceps pazoutovae]|uniref:Uncharacterized protein n=1 Tax=Claviceps pazoutovae TaxID=1649127 RepID=A0A9P7M9B0_9HYPO|nr:hypothetical protein E4U60_004122 [Claviceps pazoutovae]